LDPQFEKNNLIWTCSHDKTICAWDAQTGNCKKVFQGHTKAVTCILIKDGILFSGSYDRTVRYWNIDTAICKRVYTENENWITAILVERGLLFCAGYDACVNIYDVESCKKLKTLKGHAKRIDDMFLSEDGVLYTASADGTVRSWDTDAGKLLHVYNCRDHVLSVHVYNQLLLCGQHQQLTCWDIEKHKLMAPYVGISVFHVVNDVLIGWNRVSQQFEFWDLTSNTLLETLEDKSLINVSDIKFYFTAQDAGILYYGCGNQVLSKKVNVQLFDDEVTESLATDTSLPPTPCSAVPINDEFNYAEQPAVQKANQHGTKPTYMLYPNLFNYYVNVLLHSPTTIAAIIDELHDVLSTCKTFDGQIDKVAEMLHKYELENRKGKKKMDKGTLADQAQFEIMVHPMGDKNKEACMHTQEEIRKAKLVYSEEELALDFETRTEIFYQRIRKSLMNEHQQLQPTVILVRREHLVFDTCKHFSVLNQDDLKKQMYIFFAGEQGLGMHLCCFLLIIRYGWCDERILSTSFRANIGSKQCPLS
jgi:WD40 repeat protein